MASEKTLAGWAGLVEGLREGVQEYQGKKERTKAVEEEKARYKQQFEYQQMKDAQQAQRDMQIMAMQMEEQARSAARFEREMGKFDLEMDQLRRNSTTRPYKLYDPTTGETVERELTQAQIDQLTVNELANVQERGNRVPVEVNGTRLFLEPTDAARVLGKGDEEFQKDADRATDMINTLIRLAAEPPMTMNDMNMAVPIVDPTTGFPPTPTELVKMQWPQILDTARAAFPRLANAGYFDKLAMPGEGYQQGVTRLWDRPDSLPGVLPGPGSYRDEVTNLLIRNAMADSLRGSSRPESTAPAESTGPKRR